MEESREPECALCSVLISANCREKASRRQIYEPLRINLFTVSRNIECFLFSFLSLFCPFRRARRAIPLAPEKTVGFCCKCIFVTSVHDNVFYCDFVMDAGLCVCRSSNAGAAILQLIGVEFKDCRLLRFNVFFSCCSQYVLRCIWRTAVGTFLYSPVVSRDLYPKLCIYC